MMMRKDHKCSGGGGFRWTRPIPDYDGQAGWVAGGGLRRWVDFDKKGRRGLGTDEEK